MRLDQYLASFSLVETRSKASQLIKAGKVTINGKVMTNKGYDVKEKDKVEIQDVSLLTYVSRGGLKLEKAIQEFSLDFQNKVICDIGSSTGGFTDCALKHGAKKVYAIDVGTSQLHPSLRSNPKVVVMEQTNFRYLDRSRLTEKPDFYTADVSFISIKEILLHLLSFQEDFQIVLLFKPQFEVGPNKINDHGVVKEDKYLVEALKDFEDFLKKNHLFLLHITYSPILGEKEGNMEFLMEVSTKGTSISFSEVALVEEAKKALKK